jgi:hypothetical protein
MNDTCEYVMQEGGSQRGEPKKATFVNTNQITERLAEPFPAAEVGWKPQSVKGNRAMAIAYIDARNVMDRLDEVVGVAGWQDRYESLPDGSVVCRLTVEIDGKRITKTDVGSPSEQPDGGDRMKAAFSDALKRAAVKFGIGRYLYSLDSIWCDYDPLKRQFVQKPQLPAWALPSAKKPPQPQVRPMGSEVFALASRELSECKTLPVLKALWESITATKAMDAEQFAAAEKIKNEMKAKLSTASPPAPVAK